MNRWIFALTLTGWLTISPCLWGEATRAEEGSQSAFVHVSDLSPGPVRDAFEKTGSALINNLNLVKIEGDQPVLIRGGGFTQANLDWLVLDMGIRTIIDLRGKFNDDKTNQVIARSPEVLAYYKAHGGTHKLENLEPKEVSAYIESLARTHHIPLQYVQATAEDPKLLPYLDKASVKEPVAMFCQWGINRSGTAWAAWAKHLGWTQEQALKAFGVPLPDGTYRNKRDIVYGYNLHRTK